ncbi:uncharacterized protein LOC110706990 isoform X4 [Chenopodium quinoa]|uniref:uncharacterized protein LOC110706990 isoform X4 n=1 Tax=Chenopodium quinoa TaxID=63459 RepID=UPI000B77CED7|nr:uncharacterized protein LOC110706990 isoform X4 [Chenopodium quinoa]
MEAGTAAAKPIINVAAICGSFPYNIDLLRAGGRSKTEQGLVDSSLSFRLNLISNGSYIATCYKGQGLESGESWERNTYCVFLHW